MSTRREAREVALKALYAVESSEVEIEPVVTELASEAGLSPRLSAFCLCLCQQVGSYRAMLDGLISRHLEHWSLERVARIDRILLRMALAEFLFFEDIPPKVSIDEAIELARRFSTAQSPGFVNGILDAIMMGEEKVDR
jgi:N utilization substance protein B